MRSQAEIDSLLQQFIGQYAGKQADYYGYLGECLSLEKRWFDVLKNGQLNGPMTAPPSSDGWGSGYWVNPPGSVLELLDKANYDPNADYPAGSMLVNTATHHIMTLIANNPGNSTATVFEQNADPDGSAAHTAQRDKSRIDGILVLKVAQPAPVVPMITLDQLNQLYHDLLNRAPDVAGIQHYVGHFTYDFVQDDIKKSAEYATVHAPKPAPYVPPAPPVTAQLAEKYTLIVPCMAFTTQGGAQNHSGMATTLTEGSYFVWDSKDATKLLGTSNTTRPNPETWINIQDNVLPPEPKPAVQPQPATSQPVEVSVHWLNPDHSSAIYRYSGSTSVSIKDLSAMKPPMNLLPGTKGPVSRFAMVSGVDYLLPDKTYDQGLLYGIPSGIMQLYTEKPLNRIEDVVKEAADWQTYENTGKGVYQAIDRLFTDVAHDLGGVDKLVAVRAKAKTAVKQVIDGFSARRK